MNIKDFQIDNSQILQENIEKETQKKLTEFKNKLDEFKEKKTHLTELEIQRLEKQFQRKEETEKEKIQKKFYGKIEPDKKVSILKQKGTLMKELFEMTNDAFLTIYQTNQYSEFLQFLFKDIAQSLKESLSVIRVHPEDKNILSLSSNIKIKEDDSIRGIIGTDKDEHILVDNTLQGWFRKKKNQLKEFLVQEIDKLYRK